MRQALTIRKTMWDEHTDTISSRDSLAAIEAKLNDSSSR